MELRVVYQPEMRSKKRRQNGSRRRAREEDSTGEGQERGEGSMIQIIENYMPDLYCKIWQKHCITQLNFKTILYLEHFIFLCV